MTRTFKKKSTNARRQKPVALIIAEGKNVTEAQYFKSLRHQQAPYNIKVLIPGHITDPAGMQNRIEKYWRENELDEQKGDLAYIVLDLDCSRDKAGLIRNLAGEHSIAEFIV